MTSEARLTSEATTAAAVAYVAPIGVDPVTSESLAFNREDIGDHGREITESAMVRRACDCRECGAAFLAIRSTAVFCSPSCRLEFNNRRRDRGAELYDLVMAMRYERGFAKALHIWTVVCNLARAYRDSDHATRNGRKSWDSAAVLKRLPNAYGRNGDKR